MQPLRNTIIEFVKNHGEDEELFLHDLEAIVEKEGDLVFPVLLNVLTQLEFSDLEAKGIWEEILKHRKKISQSLSRQVNLLTAICDYFLTVRKAFTYPKVVELKVFEEASHYSKCDYLTGLYNRGYFEEALQGEISRAKRYKTEFSLIFFDIDNFKRINDTVGHLGGDLALSKIADLIRTEKRGEDIAARYGGEELVLVLPSTSKSNAVIKAERIRQKISELPLSFGGINFSVTMSGGIATYPHDAITAEGIIECADQALYRSKASGKNQINLYSSDKRQYVRADFAGPVVINRLDNWLNYNQVSATGKDLSLSGMLFESSEVIEIGSRIQLQVPIPNPQNPTILLGTVVRLESLDPGYDIGVSFVQVRHKEQKEILDFLIKQSQFSVMESK